MTIADFILFSWLGISSTALLAFGWKVIKWNCGGKIYVRVKKNLR